MAVDPIHQFQITKLFTIGHIGGQEIAFTNSSAYMFGGGDLASDDRGRAATTARARPH
jgi:hypothetical protein